MQIINAEDAASLIEDGWSIIPGGFGSCGHPDCLTAAIKERFVTTGSPRNLSLLFGPGAGDKKGNGIDSLALKGLVGKAIGGFWGLSPRLSDMASNGDMEAHNWPQGVISKMFSAIACGQPGIFTHIGIDTFIDPDIEGGVIDTRGTPPLVEKVTFKGRTLLFYPSQNVNCALLRGTYADQDGNISFCEETSYMDALAQAQAVKKCGGIVVVQVKKVVDRNSIPPSEVRIPGVFVDYVVVAPEENHPQTYGTHFNSSYIRAGDSTLTSLNKEFPLAKKIISTRAALEIGKHRNANVNLGIGIPALIGEQAMTLGIKDFTLSVESGLIGGKPDEGLSFGAVHHPQAMIEQSALFDFYDGGGLDLAFLGFAEVDGRGNVNVSKFGGRIVGSGGFINIAQNAKKIVFCGTLTARGLQIKSSGGKLKILKEGEIKKFRPSVSQLTFNGASAVSANREVLYITERAVFKLRHDGMQLTEIAPGIDVDELKGCIDFDFSISPELIEMPGCDLIC